MLSRRSRMASHLSRAWLPTRTSTQQRLFKRGISKLPQSVYLTPPYPPQDLRQTLALACQAASLHQNVADEEPSTSSRRATLEKSMDALSSKEDSASEDVSNEPALPDRDSLESHPAERNYRGITYIRFPRDRDTQEYQDVGMVVVDSSKSAFVSEQRQQEVKMRMPKPHPKIFTSIAAGYNYSEQVVYPSIHDAEDSKFACCTDPRHADEEKQTLSWNHIGQTTFSSLNPLRLRHVAPYIGLLPMDGIYNEKADTRDKKEPVLVTRASPKTSCLHRPTIESNIGSFSSFFRSNNARNSAAARDQELVANDMPADDISSDEIAGDDTADADVPGNKVGTQTDQVQPRNDGFVGQSSVSSHVHDI